ncbi:MAG: bifunctional aspartate kinase/homoserine dehydrogenase I, partial [Ignavibacteriaceae bacterium]|nr:bifunctional aspartate kinase/homoserine dehydrogenase I [Ignavibacteriaceae bacterium]
MKIIKFGGTSVGTPQNILKSVAIVKSKSNEGLLGVVFSAYSGITDKLIKTANLAKVRDIKYLTLYGEICELHFLYAKEVIQNKNLLTEVIESIQIILNELKEILDGVYLLKELSLKSLDYVQSIGERLSCTTITGALQDREVKAQYLDARSLVKTDDNFTNARVLKEITYKNINDFFINNNELQIITGFTGSTLTDETTTLGRGGSDFTASIFGAALNVKEIEIWTDVDGVLTTDPKKVKSAQIIKELTYSETMELSYFGAKVIYAPTLQPAQEKKIPIRIKNTFNPMAPGSLISSKIVNSGRFITGIACIENISLIRIEGAGMVGVVGFAGRLFSTLARLNINVVLISQASSEHSICFAINPVDLIKAIESLKKEFNSEIQHGEIEGISFDDNLSIIAVVGESMRHKPGISGNIFNVLGRRGINISAIAQGSSELNISLLVERSRVNEAINSLHIQFFNNRKVRLYLAGPGKIGSKVINLLLNNETINKLVSVSSIFNSKKMIINDEGINLVEFANLLEKDNQPLNIDQVITHIKNDIYPFKIFVDTSDSDVIADKYQEIIKSGANIVSANKAANTKSLEKYFEIRQLLKEKKLFFKYETNVGSALPIIETIQNLVRNGDKVRKIRGVLSGSINYILTKVNAGVSFEVALKEAVTLGLTEPDPKIDLSGVDVARKILILARECGYKGEMEDIYIENFLDQNSKNGFKDIDKMSFEARQNGKKLKYIAEYSNHVLSVKIENVDSDNEFFNVDENNNSVSLYSNLYNNSPLVITGYGAGVDLTASGVFSDIVSLIKEQL